MLPHFLTFLWLSNRVKELASPVVLMGQKNELNRQKLANHKEGEKCMQFSWQACQFVSKQWQNH
jgi:hypothetical protein